MKRSEFVVVAAVLLTGVATTMLGPLMPTLELRWHLTDARAGLLFTAQFAAAVVVSAMVGPLAARWGYFRLLARSLVLIALGVASCALGSWPLLVVGVVLYGCGLGGAIPAANLGVAALAGAESARPLLRLNLIWSIGAIAAPALVAGLGAAFLWVLAAAFAGFSVALATAGAGPRPLATKRAVSITAIGWLTAALLFSYVGTEASLSGWLASYAARGTDRGVWALAPSVFWGSILLGRVTAPALLRKMPLRVLLPVTMLCGFAGTVLLLADRGPLWMVAATAVCGFGLAPIFPMVVSQYANARGGSGLVFAAASLGGAAIPALVGFVSTGSGSLRTGLSALLAWIAIMVALQLVLTRRT